MTAQARVDTKAAEPMDAMPIAALPNEFAAIIDRFDQAWHRGLRPAIRNWLPSAGNDNQITANRGLLLHELIQVDLEYRWRRKPSTKAYIENAAPPRLDDYIHEFPELGSIEKLSLELVADEYRVRCRWGDQPKHVEYLARFSSRAESVAIALREIDRQLEGEAFGVETSSDRPLPLNPHPAVARRPSVSDPLATLPHADYRLQRRIGSGGMGKVYLALQKSRNRQVAVKVLKKSYWTRPGAIELFRREARIVAELRHPGIVAIQGLGQFPAGGYFIVMDYVPGGDLEAHGGTNPIPLNDALRWVAEVAQAIHYAHQHGVVHCDLKPSNVLLDAGGRAVVTDFGLARPVTADWTNLVELAGTAAYMAPEQIDSQWGQVGPATDIHGLGGLLFALLTGHPPVMEHSVLDSLASILSGRQPPALAAFRDDVPQHIAGICASCLQPKPSDRPATAHWVAQQLRWVAGG